MKKGMINCNYWIKAKSNLYNLKGQRHMKVYFIIDRDYCCGRCRLVCSDKEISVNDKGNKIITINI